MENTRSSKLKYFGHHLFEMVMFGDLKSTLIGIDSLPLKGFNVTVKSSAEITIGPYEKWDIDHTVLVLNDIKSMDDDELTKLAKQFDISIGNEFLEDYTTLQEFRDSLREGLDNCWPVAFFDHLRESGYATPFNGRPVKWLVENNWLKIRED
jgi:hypothetical protein